MNDEIVQEAMVPYVKNALVSAIMKDEIFSVTDDKGTIIFANPKFAEISKYPASELVGQNHRILKSGEQPDELFADMWSTISTGKVWRGEIKNRAKDGSFYWVDAMVFPIFDLDGGIKNYASVRTLINDKKEAEEKLKEHLKELERMNKFAVDRELRMVELKREIKKLEIELEELKKSDK